uniref:Uncharacterized protein n=1 Tax=Rhizophora mucronata TaxID=61149 RepID=A0A2P2NJ52_RHIMU
MPKRYLILPFLMETVNQFCCCCQMIPHPLTMNVVFQRRLKGCSMVCLASVLHKVSPANFPELSSWESHASFMSFFSGPGFSLFV